MTTIFQPAVSESTASTRLRAGGAVVRKAKLPDGVNIFDLVNSLSGDGTLLRRSYAEICENVRDFAVAESPVSGETGGVFLGCGALHLYGPHLAEVRSIAHYRPARNSSRSRLKVTRMATTGCARIGR